MKRRTIPWLLTGFALIGGAIFISQRPRWQPGGTGQQTAPISNRVDPSGIPSEKSHGRSMPLHQARLTAAEKRQVDADPAKACAENPKNLNLLVAWAALDPEAALAWINAGNPKAWIEDGTEISQAFESLIGAIAAGILIKDGAQAMQGFVTAHQEDPKISAKNQGELLKYAMFHLGRADTIAAALPLMHGEDGAELAGMMVLGAGDTHDMTRAIDYLETKGIKVAVDYWAFQDAIDRDPRYWADWAQQRDSKLLEEIVHGWSRANADDARAWLKDRLPADDPRRKKIEELINL